MKIIIDTDKKVIEVPNELKKAYDLLGNNCNSILSLVNTSDFIIKGKSNNTNGDKTNQADIEAFMESVKDTEKAKYEEYTKLKNAKVGKSKNGKPIKTNFLNVKKWFYENFPDQKPKKK